ncbi:MAG: hypothetical protein ACK4R6_11105 [Spirosomataceae bacterium]
MKKIFTLAIALLIAENSFAIGFPSNNVYIHHKLNHQKIGTQPHLLASKEVITKVEKPLVVCEEVVTDQEEEVLGSTEERMSLLQVMGAFFVQFVLQVIGIRL